MTNLGIRTVDLYANGINVELDGIRIGRIDLPSGYVPYSFMPIIDQHHVITGDMLANGMIVLVESAHRENPETLSPEYPARRHGFRPTDYDRRRVQETSRWALVTDFEQRGNIISFTAIYADGTMSERGGYNQSIKWALLKNYKFEGVPDACGFCGEVHEKARSVAEDAEDQPFYDMLDGVANFIGTLLFPEADTEEARITAVKESATDFLGGFVEELKSIFNESDLEDEAPEEGPRDGETDDEYADRLRDEAEIADQYDENEAANLRKQKQYEEDLAELREKLSGRPRP